MITLSKTARKSARDYVPALLEACELGDVDPVDFLTDTAEHEEVSASIDMSEFLVGWFHGVAEAHDVDVKRFRALWAWLVETFAPEAKPARPRAKRALASIPDEPSPRKAKAAAKRPAKLPAGRAMLALPAGDPEPAEAPPAIAAARGRRRRRGAGGAGDHQPSLIA